MKTITISRAKWLRGTGGGELLRGETMCCLGFVSIECGLTPEDIRGFGMPNGPLNFRQAEVSPFPTLVARNNDFFESTKAADDLAASNDDRTITDDQREQELTGLARKAGFNFVFVP